MGHLFSHVVLINFSCALSSSPARGSGGLGRRRTAAILRQRATASAASCFTSRVASPSPSRTTSSCSSPCPCPSPCPSPSSSPSLFHGCAVRGAKRVVACKTTDQTCRSPYSSSMYCSIPGKKNTDEGGIGGGCKGCWFVLRGAFRFVSSKEGCGQTAHYMRFMFMFLTPAVPLPPPEVPVVNATVVNATQGAHNVCSKGRSLARDASAIFMT